MPAFPVQDTRPSFPKLEGVDPEDYPIHKMAILADVAPYSRECNTGLSVPPDTKTFTRARQAENPGPLRSWLAHPDHGEQAQVVSPSLRTQKTSRARQTEAPSLIGVSFLLRLLFLFNV